MLILAQSEGGSAVQVSCDQVRASECCSVLLVDIKSYKYLCYVFSDVVFNHTLDTWAALAPLRHNTREQCGDPGLLILHIKLY